MRRKFATNLLFLFAANLLVKPFWIFGIDRVVQNKVGPEMYGTYFAVFNYSFILSILLDFGINNFNNRAISRQPARAGEYLMNLLAVKSVLSIAYFLLTMLTALATGFKPEQMTMLLFLALNQILLSAILYLRSNLAALQLFKTDSLISTLDRLLTIIFCLALLYLPSFHSDFNILWFIYAQTFALFITACVSFLIVLNRSGFAMNWWKLKFTRMVLFKSMPFALLTLLMGIYYRIDAVMIERMLPDGARQAGIYAASFRLLDAVNMFGYLFATLLLPMFAGMIRRNEQVKELVKFSSELMFVMSVIVSLQCWFFRTEIMTLLYHHTDAYWSTIFGWLMLNFIPMSSVYIFGTLLTAKGSLKMLNYIALGGMVMNVALNLVLIPRYQAFGATIATLLTQLAVALAHILVVNHTFRFDFPAKGLWRPAVFLAGCFGILQATLSLSGLHWMASLSLAFLCCLLLSALLRLLPVKEAWAMVRDRS